MESQSQELKALIEFCADRKFRLDRYLSGSKVSNVRSIAHTTDEFGVKYKLEYVNDDGKYYWIYNRTGMCYFPISY